MDNSFLSQIESSTSVLVLLPSKPTFDQVASGVSLYLTLMNKKPVTVSCPSPMMVGFNRIIGVQKITSELGNKNLTIKFKNYDAAQIEKVSYDIIEGEFNLTLVPKSGFSAPTGDQVNLGFSGISADLIILVGGKEEADFPALQSPDLSKAKIAHIGNRGFTSSQQVMDFANPASSISEIVGKLIRDQGLGEIDPDIATNLLMGIEEESNNFASAETTPDTFEIFAYLLKNGGRRAPAAKLNPMNFPPGAIPGMPFTQQQVAQVLKMPPTPAPIGASAGMQVPQMPYETDVMDQDGTGETEQEINPPADWLKPKVYTGGAPPQTQQPATFSENKG